MNTEGQGSQINYEQVSARVQKSVPDDQWAIGIVCHGSGSYQFQSLIRDMKPRDCFVLSPGNRIYLSPAPAESYEIIYLTFSEDNCIIDNLTPACPNLIYDMLKSDQPLTTFHLTKDYFELVDKYSQILICLQEDALPYSMAIYRSTMDALLMLLARCAAICQTKKQASEAITSRLLMIENIKHAVNQNYSGDLSLSAIAEDFFINPSYLSRIFKEITGSNFTNYINYVRIEKAKQALLDTDNLILDIALSCGFNYIPHFNAVFKKFEGITPKEYRKLHKKRFY